MPIGPYTQSGWCESQLTDQVPFAHKFLCARALECPHLHSKTSRDHCDSYVHLPICLDYLLRKCPNQDSNLISKNGSNTQAKQNTCTNGEHPEIAYYTQHGDPVYMSYCIVKTRFTSVFFRCDVNDIIRLKDSFDSDFEFDMAMNLDRITFADDAKEVSDVAKTNLIVRYDSILNQLDNETNIIDIEKKKILEYLAHKFANNAPQNKKSRPRSHKLCGA